MKRKVFVSILALCIMTGLAESLKAQAQFGSMHNDRLGTAAAMELLIPVGARDMAMNGSGIATSKGVDAIFWNPGGLGRMQGGAEGMFSSMRYIASINVNYGAVALNFGGFGMLGLSVKAIDYGDIPLTTVDDPEGIAGRSFSPSFIAVGVTYARAFTDAITAGANLKIISQDMHRVTGSGFALDAGIQYHGVAGFNGLMFGVALKNLGPQVSYDGPGLLRLADPEEGRRPAQFFKSQAASWELPSSVEMGLAYSGNVNEQFSYSVNGTFANNNLTLDAYKFGGEVVYGMQNVEIAGRAGIEMLQKDDFDEQIFGPAFGFGLNYVTPGVDITVDYAYRSVDFFDNNSMFSLKLGF